MSDDDPVGRARWTGVADGPVRRTRHAKYEVADLEFIARQGKKSGWVPIHDTELVDQLSGDEDFEVHRE